MGGWEGEGRGGVHWRGLGRVHGAAAAARRRRNAEEGPQTPPLEAAGCRWMPPFGFCGQRKKLSCFAGLVPFGNSIERGPRLRIYRSTKSGRVGAESSGKNNSATCVVGRLGSGARPRSFSRLTKMDVWSHRRFACSSLGKLETSVRVGSPFFCQ